MSLLTRLAIFVLCGFAGYFAAHAFVAPPAPQLPVAAASPAASLPVAKRTQAAQPEGWLLAEWEQLRTAHGGDTADLPTLYATVKDLKDAFRRRAFRAALFAEWAATNPQAGFAYLQGKDSSQASQLLREWLRLDPQAAINGLLAGDEKMRGGLRRVLSDIARLAPARLAEVVNALGGPDNRTTPINEGRGVAYRQDTYTQEAFALLAQTDPEAARAVAESVNGSLRGQALAGVAQAWAEKDAGGALAWAEAMPPGEGRDATLKAVLISWAKTDPMAALGKLDLVPPGGDAMAYNSDVGAQVLSEAAKRDWEGTLRWLSEHPGKLGSSSLNGLQSALSRRLGADPAGTMSALAKGGIGGLEMVLANTLLNDGYAAHDAIWQWLDTQKPDTFTKSARGWLLNAMSWKEPTKALEYLEKMPDTADNRQAFERGVQSLLNGGSQMDRFEDLYSKASAKVRPLLLEAGFQFGLQNPNSDPAKWVARLNELPADRRLSAVSSLAHSWASRDPEAAGQWALSLPPAQRDTAINNATAAWVRTDAYEAAEWIKALPAGKSRDTATQNLVGALARNEPEAAWEWALSVQAGDRRPGALQMAYFGLLNKDPAIANAMLQQVNLPPAERSTLQAITSTTAQQFFRESQRQYR